ncbi:MAG: response regulator [Bacteroidetes bacterium]|nr:response regulator [Bacteroidota bacterium]
MAPEKDLKVRTEQLEAKILQLENEIIAYRNEGNESRLKRAEIASRSGNWELHLESGKIFGSEGALKLYGLKNPHMDYETIKEIPLPEYRPILDSAIKELITENKLYNVEFKIKHCETGEILDLHSTAEYNPKTKIVFGIVRDITAQKASEEQIKKKNLELAVLLEITLGLLEKTDKKIVLRKILEGANRLVGLDTGAIYSISEGNLILESTIPPLPDNFSDEFRKALLVNHPHIGKAMKIGTPIVITDIANEEMTPEELVIVRQRNMRTLFFIPLIASSQKYGIIIIGTTGRIHNFSEHEIALCRTISNIASLALENSILITNLKTARDKAEESDKLKTAFLHNISHEIRTPLNAIIGFSGFLDQPDLSDIERKKFIDIIMQSNNQLLNIINDIFNVSHIEAGQVLLKESPTDVDSLLNNLYIQFLPEAQKKGLELKLEIKNFPKNGCLILTDEGKLIQVLSNLVGNAIKFTIKGHISLGCIKEKEAISFYVEDTGIGIPLSEQSRVFERFYQVDKSVSRAYSGTGLGLSISDAYIKLMGGEIKLESEHGKGSRFSFKIPYTGILSSAVNTGPVKIEHKAGNGNQSTVLVAEDDVFSYQLLELLLRKMDFRVIHAVDGKQAVDICRSGEKIDIILMDLKMPVMDGYAATAEIKKFMPDLAIIAQTAYADMEDKQRVFTSGFSDFIAKPITKSQLYSTLEKHLK